MASLLLPRRLIRIPVALLIDSQTRACRHRTTRANCFVRAYASDSAAEDVVVKRPRPFAPKPRETPSPLRPHEAPVPLKPQEGVGAIVPQRAPMDDSSPESRPEKGSTSRTILAPPADLPFRSFIAFGSNIGDRIYAIESALRAIDEDPAMFVMQASPLYETDPMYVTDQGQFLNGVCQIATSLQPEELLDRLQAIENNLGRVKIIDKGPRNIDLDILTYDNKVYNSPRLNIPHLQMMEREFVLRPMSKFWEHPVTGITVEAALEALPATGTMSQSVVALGPPDQYLRRRDATRSTRIMAILNTTPDSFSDGGQHNPDDVDALRASISAHIAAGATIIDVGGQSSRPGAPDVTAEEELARVLPAIAAFRSLPESETAHVALSVDTYRARVAREAVAAGAHIVNDISAGQLDPEMLRTVAELGCTYVITHMRGTPATMNDSQNTTYGDDSPPRLPYAKAPPMHMYEMVLLNGIADELRERVREAKAAGIRPWRIILDPGIGFSKTAPQNLIILRRLEVLREHKRTVGFPWLVGSSRKAFIGDATGAAPASARDWGTAATVTAAVQGGADIVRVHATAQMRDVVSMADAIWRIPTAPPRNKDDEARRERSQRDSARRDRPQKDSGRREQPQGGGNRSARRAQAWRAAGKPRAQTWPANVGHVHV